MFCVPPLLPLCSSSCAFYLTYIYCKALCVFVLVISISLAVFSFFFLLFFFSFALSLTRALLRLSHHTLFSFYVVSRAFLHFRVAYPFFLTDGLSKIDYYALLFPSFIHPFFRSLLLARHLALFLVSSCLRHRLSFFFFLPVHDACSRTRTSVWFSLRSLLVLMLLLRHCRSHHLQYPVAPSKKGL